ncbi:GGDEF domain-containing protein [Terrisporobacter mayombei]|uniref:Sensor domain-containing diguanylate cyclase n=1 Tax=Terrisporobacter mayombei TaxID=1541 RepID=A0ABY9Q1Q4_9FIRM|nr:GGDEF domain-containing protein [Terrisporobacter mayombei]MCC3866963.1 GGDEF domain-containing protein [Terrisporobacter mayombei]WMT81210.1 hypothetical protein TEMA_15440 [Terrisporobacter mayombei]
MIDEMNVNKAANMYSLRQSEHSMDLSSTEEMVHSLNNEGKIIEVSPCWLKTTGYERTEVIGRFFGEFLLDESRAVVYNEFSHLKDYGFVNNVRLKLKRKDGVVMEIVLNGTSRYQEDGAFERTFCEWRSLDYFINSVEKVNQLLIKEKFFRMIGYIKSNITLLLLKGDDYNYCESLSEILNEPSEVKQATVEPNVDKFEKLDTTQIIRINEIKEQINANELKGQVNILRSDSESYTAVMRVNDELIPRRERILLIDFICSEYMLKDWKEAFLNLCKLIESVTQMIKTNLEVKRLVGELQIACETDRLTGINNRMILERILSKQKDSYDRYKEKSSVIMVDIDYFKNINDIYGHNVGDKVLVEIAYILRENIRKTDAVGRWGGEEFLIVCEHTGIEDAMVIAESLRNKIECHMFEENIHLTSSFGVGEFSEGLSIEQVIDTADKALYKSKHSGRNLVCSCERE